MAYRKDEVLKPLQMRPSEIAFERYYYSQPSPEGGHDNNTLEDFFSTIEGTWPPLVDRLHSGSAISSDLEAFYNFMGRLLIDFQARRSRHIPQNEPQYMPLYVTEFQFRYNNRENADIFGTAIKGC